MMTSSVERRRRRALLLASAGVLLTSCGTDAPTMPTPTEASCNGVSVAVRSLAPLEHVIISSAQAACFALAGGNREYLVVPQLTGAALPYGGYQFRLGEPTALAALAVSPGALPPRSMRIGADDISADTLADAPRRFDALLRAREARWIAPSPADRVRAVAAPNLNVTGSADTLRRFSVLNTLGATPAYTPVTARLRFAGTRVLLYVDTLANSALSDGELQGMGALYDQRLAPAVTASFGDGSDIDGNGRVVFLLTPTVNALVTATQCASTGFIRGFFYNHDLTSTDITSNRAEIFYAYVPDEGGRWSCAHRKADVLANLPPTFMHELQHMISFGEHALERNGPAEEVWLNEALSHMAEEIGSLSYETRFPAPSGRTNPASIFPDSASPFINPNLLYSYRYLFSSATYSLTSCAVGTFCTLAERGGTWLMLRWIADQQGAATLRRLVETNLAGRANLEAATGRSTAALLGEFALAVSTDSISGMPRSTAPASLRFNSRNLRRLYRSLFDAFGIAGGVGRSFPIEPLPLAAASAVTGTMRPGTFLTYRLRLTEGVPTAVLRFLAGDGTPFPLTSGAQISIVRLP
jgi:hypothetical protein